MDTETIIALCEIAEVLVLSVSLLIEVWRR